MVCLTLAAAYREKFGGDHIDDVREAMTFHCLSTLDEAFALTLVPNPRPAARAGVLEPVG